MTDPRRSDASATAGARARSRGPVEELLLTGLDHYFAGQHELAISVWTRVLFLDRGHARARAYIERARGAIAERQREGEELVHTGAAAFQRGESEAARRLLTSAVERGAGTEEALALLDRLERLEAAGVQQESRAGRRTAPAARTRRRRSGGSIDRGSDGLPPARSWASRRWRSPSPCCGPAARTGCRSAASRPRARRSAPSDEPLPVPSASEVWLARALGPVRERAPARGARRARRDPSRRSARRAKPTSCAPRSSASCSRPRAPATSGPAPPPAPQDVPRQ